MRTVDFTDLYGKKIAIEIDRIAFRPSVYALVVHDGSILLCNTKSTGKYSLPGGGIDLGEKIEDALKREVYEECGIEIVIDRFVSFEERFFYYNPTDNAWQIHAFFFLCRPVTFELSSHDPSELEAEKPRWVDVATLRLDDFQVFGETVLKALEQESGF